MTLKDMSLQEIKRKIEDSFSLSYETAKTETDGNWFVKPDGGAFRVSQLGTKDPWGCFVIEHAESIEKTIGAEDGDLFYPEDYGSLEELITAITQEIK